MAAIPDVSTFLTYQPTNMLALLIFYILFAMVFFMGALAIQDAKAVTTVAGCVGMAIIWPLSLIVYFIHQKREKSISSRN